MFQTLRKFLEKLLRHIIINLPVAVYQVFGENGNYILQSKTG